MGPALTRFEPEIALFQCIFVFFAIVALPDYQTRRLKRLPGHQQNHRRGSQLNELNIPTDLSPQDFRDQIVAFEKTILQGEQVHIPVTQYFSKGVYCREITIPAGVILTGKIHKHPCMSVVLTGKMEVITDQGPRIIEAPLVYESPAGVKRAGKALEDCRWLTVHPWDGPELDEDQMAAELTVDTFEQLSKFQQEQITCQS